MRTLIDNYVFDASAKRITLPNARSIALERLLIITNVTSNVVIYNFADPACGAMVSGNVITLDYDTTSMSDTDKLQIYYESDESQEMLMSIYKAVNFARDVNDRLRIIMDNSPMLYTYMRNSGTGMAGSTEGWYSVSSWNTVDAREQLMQISNQSLIMRIGRWS